MRRFLMLLAVVAITGLTGCEDFFPPDPDYDDGDNGGGKGRDSGWVDPGDTLWKDPNGGGGRDSNWIDTTNGGGVASYVGVHWRLVSYETGGRIVKVGPNIDAHIIFDGGNNASGSGGCNGYGVVYKADGYQMAFGDLLQTEMACMDERGTVEDHFFQGLQTTNMYKFYANELHLYGSGKVSALHFAR